jgi:hypothetical protein
MHDDAAVRGRAAAHWFHRCISTTTAGNRVPPQPSIVSRVNLATLEWRRCMKKTLAVLATVVALGATVVTAPAEARGRFGFGVGPGLALGLAAGAVAAGAYGAFGPGYYGPGYGYYGYGPRYYGRAYYPGPYAYSGGPYYRRPYGYGW